MVARIASDLAREVEASRAHPGRELRVIVTLAPACDPAALERAGLRIERRFELLGAVGGRVAAGAVNALAALPEAEEIELDGTTRAL